MTRALGGILAIGAASLSLAACTDDGPDVSAIRSVPEQPGDTTRASLVSLPPLAVVVAWASDGIQISMLEDEQPTISMTCNDIGNTRTSPGDVVNVVLPTAGEADVDCVISNGYTFHLQLPGLERLPEGEFRRDPTAEAVLAQCGASREDGRESAAWRPGLVWLECGNEVVTFEPDPASEFILFKTAVEG